ncbi:MAG: hydantoinase/oxoprolinase family protein [Gammaproteobacteria bacterium]|nr:hydantoinase/oxoprolinase family protein [Gammaproteobacteria bacterium]MDD9957497.1 hydantoinase/oxoprolinase family protein [Gammaproteobacteria bacterium]
MRIGIDVGGTHTDAVLMDGLSIISSHKALTTPDVRQGIIEALDTVMSEAQAAPNSISAVMIGTTHFTNAVIERRELSETAIIRACLPTGSGLPPMCDWPGDIAAALGNHGYMIRGGHLFNGKPIAELDEVEIEKVIDDIAANNIKDIAIAAAFSPANAAHENQIAEKVRQKLPHANVSLSHEIGRLGILERENAALLNASLGDLAQRVVSNMRAALTERRINCPFYVSQNDGTLMSADYIARYPALTFSSGPTNSLRGAAILSGIDNAIVVDIGGTSSDVGVLADGFPRESNSHIAVGGVRTNFRMPDILPIGLGGGSLVQKDGESIGPRSVGHRLVTEGLVFGGTTITATDIAVANGSCELGDKSLVSHLDAELVALATKTIHAMIDDAIDKMRPSEDPVPIILVGGGAILISRQLETASEIIHPQHADVANAIGASIAQVGGEVEHIVSYSRIPRDEAMVSATKEAEEKAIAAGADETSLRVLDVEETTMSYMDDDAARIRVKVVGDLKQAK